MTTLLEQPKVSLVGTPRFINKLSTDEEVAAIKAQKRRQAIETYKQTGDIRATARMTGITEYVLFIWLNKAGVLFANDRLNYGTTGMKMGARMEIEFKTLVPTAQAMNSDSHNHPGFDFNVGKFRVDIKSSTLRQYRGKTGHWGFDFKRSRDKRAEFGADFYVCFAMHQENGDAGGGYDVYVIPSALCLSHKSMTVRKGHPSVWDGFRIPAADLAAFFQEINA